MQTKSNLPAVQIAVAAIGGADASQAKDGQAVARVASQASHTPASEDAETYRADRTLHAMLARLSGGISPTALLLAYTDWLSHLAASPQRRLEIAQEGIVDTQRFFEAAQRFFTPGQGPWSLIKPPPQDKRFARPDSITEPSLSTSGGPDGFFFRSPNERKIVQARLDGFTFNKLKPYENWELFSSEAKRLWSIFCQVANPIKITRVALRYINKIFFPLPMKDFKEYILTIPEVAPNLPQGLTHLFARLVIPKPEIEALAIITETMEEPNQDQKLPFIFDIDVFKGIDYSEPDRIWKDFEELRQFKNEVFFNSLTEKAKEMFK